MSTDERTKALIEKIESDLISEGYSNTISTYKHNPTGPCSYDNFFDYLVDLRLDGSEIPSIEELWITMKEQYNYLYGNLLKASEDYAKLENRERHLRKDLNNITKENWRLLNKIKELEASNEY